MMLILFIRQSFQAKAQVHHILRYHQIQAFQVLSLSKQLEVELNSVYQLDRLFLRSYLQTILLY